MTPEDVVRAWFKEIWNESREDAIDRLAGDTFVGAVSQAVSS
jgi:hypothetical protein